MIESHHDPDSALSDKKQQITPDQLNDLLNETAVFQSESDKTAELHLNTLRTEINDIDKQLIALLDKRFQICRKIGSVKKNLNISILQSRRWNEILESRIKIAKEKEIPADLVTSLFKLIHEESLRIQQEMINS